MFQNGNIARSFFSKNRLRNLSDYTDMTKGIMKFNFLLILILFFGFAENGFSQYSNPQAESRYKAGVSDYKQKRYAAAIEKLSPLTSGSTSLYYTPYAHYYFALSTYQLKRYRESKQMLMQLLSKYPGWAKINDVYYLLAADFFETSQTKEGLEYLQKIKESSFAKDVQSLKQHHYAAVNDLTQLIVLHKQYPTDRDLALVLVDFIENSPTSTKTDLQFAEQLEKQFKLSSKEKAAVAEERPKRSIPKRDNQWTKGYFDVSVLLPFRLEDFNTSKKRTNQFAYDYYLGLTMAKEKLKSEGVNINLWAYDVGTDPKPMQSIVDNAAFQQSDMVIGPLYAGTFDVAADYVADARMIMLNPLSTDPNLLKTGNNVYLAHPAIPFQVQRAVQFMKYTAPGMSAAIYFGSTTKDSLMAYSYAEELKSKGGRVIEMFKIHSDREWMESKISTFETIKPSHITLFSSDVNAGTMLIEVVNGRKLTTTPILATSTSFNLQQSRIGKYGSRLYLLETDHVDREKEGIREFQKNYWNLNNTFPSVYSYQGYDQMLFFGRMLNQYKDDVARGIGFKKYLGEDYLLSGFDYTKSHDNQISPVLRYSGSKWVPAY